MRFPCWRVGFALALFATLSGCGASHDAPVVPKSGAEDCPDCCEPKSRAQLLRSAQEKSTDPNSESSSPVSTKE